MNGKDFYLIGRRLPHSLSPRIHKLYGAYGYALRELEPDEVAEYVLEKNYDGLNVTIPYKKRVCGLMDELSETAERTGVVNTVVKNGDRLKGYNTDYAGFEYLLKSEGIELCGKRIAILGDGGAAATVKTAAYDKKAASVTVFGHGAIENGIMCEADILINCTPVGMYPLTAYSPTNLNCVKGVEIVIDTIYNPLKTRLLQDAESRGLKTVCGLKMLAAQAKASAELFTGAAIADEKINEAYTKLLSEIRNIVLIGMGGSGKTVIAAALGNKTGREVIDIDAEAGKIKGKKAGEIISEEGEAEFRRVEKQIILSLENRRGSIIATGGGAVIDAENAASLKGSGLFVYIDCPPEKIAYAGRPLYPDYETALKVYKGRRRVYEKLADIIVKNDHTKTIEETAEELINEITCY